MSVTSVAIQFSIIDMLSRGIGKIRSHMSRLAAGNAEVQRSFDKMVSSAKWAAISAVSTREIYKGLKPAVRAAADLQAAMLGSKAEIAGSIKGVKALRDGLKQIKSTAFTQQALLPFDQTQLVDLEKQLLKSGATLNQVIGKRGAASAAATLAAYQGLDPVQMGKNLIGIGTPFSVTAKGFMDLADQIARASSASTVGASEIAETAKYAARGMAPLHRSTHEMLVISAMLAQRGMYGSMAGRGMSRLYENLAKYKIFHNAAGGLKSIDEVIQILRKHLGNLGDAEQLTALMKAFGQFGGPIAYALMQKTGASYAQIEEKMKNSLPLTEKMRIAMSGLNLQWTALKGTSRSTLAMLYQPALAPLSALVSKMNEFMYALGKATQKSSTLSKSVSGISLGAVGLGTAATIGLGSAMLYHGYRTLKGIGGLKGALSGLGGKASGVAAGITLQRATGVTAVFVTNWPSGGMPAAAASPLEKVEKKGLGWFGAAATASSALIPAAVATTGAILSQYAGKKISRSQIGAYNSDDLRRMMSEQEVMGGGRNSYQYRLMQQELLRRELNIHIAIDDHRAVASHDDMGAHITTTLKRGRFTP